MKRLDAGRKTDCEEFTDGMSFLYALIKRTPILLPTTMAPDNSFFRSFPLLRRCEQGIQPRRPVSREARIPLFPRLAFKLLFCACTRGEHEGGTTDWKIVVSSWRVLPRGVGRIVAVLEGGTWDRVEGHWNWWWYLKLANDHFVNLLIPSPSHPRNELESA